MVDLGAGTAVVSHVLRDAGVNYHGLEIHPVAVELMHEAGIPATQCDLSDTGAVRAALDDIGHVGALMLLDVLEHLVQPQELLSALSAWALKHGEPTLVVSVPNATHFDIGLRLLCGRWIPTTSGVCSTAPICASSPRRPSSDSSSAAVGDRPANDFSTFRIDQYDTALNDGLPTEMIGALRVLAEATNPSAAVKQFVWALKPVPVPTPPATYLDAVGDTAPRCSTSTPMHRIPWSTRAGRCADTWYWWVWSRARPTGERPNTSATGSAGVGSGSITTRIEAPPGCQPRYRRSGACSVTTRDRRAPRSVGAGDGHAPERDLGLTGALGARAPALPTRRSGRVAGEQPRALGEPFAHSLR